MVDLYIYMCARWLPYISTGVLDVHMYARSEHKQVFAQASEARF